MNVIVTGATGFVGRSLVDELLVHKDNIVVLVRDTEKIPSGWTDNVKIVKCSMNEFDKIDITSILKNKPDLFYHLAWEGTAGEVRGNESVQINNIRYSCDAIRLAVRLGCKKFIYAGSIMEYEALNNVPIEGQPLSINYIYSIAKMTADYMLRVIASSLKIDYCNVIISNIYGETEKSERFLNTLIRRMILNETIELTHGNQLYDFIHISDAVKEICLVGEAGRNSETYYIGNAEQRPLKEFILEAKKVLGSESNLEFGKVPYMGKELSFREFNTYRIEEEFKYIPKISFEEGIKRMKYNILIGE